MSTRINIEELKTLIANGIREQNLHESLPEDAVEKIKEKILAMRDRESSKQIPSIVSELDIPSVNYTSSQDSEFPDARNLTASPEQQIDMTGTTDSFSVDAGSVPAEQMSEPTIGYTPELPEMLKKAAPAELFVFRYNDIGESGENLTNKPMRLMDDPDVKKSMHDIWIQEGRTKAKIYVAKFEEIGEVDFNYTDGVSRFTEKSSLPDHAGGTEYKDNPYAEASTPQIDATTQGELETYIKSSVDLEKVVHDIVMGIVKDSLLTNTEQSSGEDPNAIQEDIYDLGTRENNGYSVAQAVKPMEEGLNKDIPTMEEIVNSDSYLKTALPNELNESINSGDKSMLIKENEFVQEWGFKGKSFYTPVNRISKNKGYTKS